MTSTCSPPWASAAAMLTVVDVLPTPPPFWLATVMIRVLSGGGESQTLEDFPPLMVPLQFAHQRSVLQVPPFAQGGPFVKVSHADLPSWIPVRDDALGPL